ncbi:unnamed protein product [Miscanthus lutarioriparius]|uniref:non-specific serine/threonine protein kinase n=1 Tax=Miscanthus lutarioriparius TaxID=422564 RepID=A0A811QYX0_9POAL|nr:unnamed protein product [Miscanthus lutarioriparius]
MSSKWVTCLRSPVLSMLLLVLLVASAGAQQTPTTRTDPIEASALKAVFVKLRQTASPAWNISGDPCTGAATNGTDMDSIPNLSPGIRCDCTDQNNTVCHVTSLKMYALDVVGHIPEELRNLTHLTYLNLQQNYLTGPIPSFLGELTSLRYMSLCGNALSGPVPKELGNLVNLTSLCLATNSLNGSLPSELGNLVKLEELYIDSAGLSGPIPSSYSKLTRMRKMQIGEIVNGSSSLAFINDMTSLSTLILRNCKISDSLTSVNFSQLTKLNILDLSFNNITGEVPQALLNLNSLNSLFLGNNSLSGSLPSSIGSSVTNIDFSYNQLSGSFPSWASQKLQVNLVANNFITNKSNNSTALSFGMECLQRNTTCFLGSPQLSSFAVDCGSRRSILGSDNSMYQPDDASLGAASYYVTGAQTWGVSNVGTFVNGLSNSGYIINNNVYPFHNTQDSELFQTARMSPSSLRYYGIGLENGNYTITLQFAEFDFEDSPTWKSLGRRGERKEQNFDIRKAAGGKSYTVVKKQYIVLITRNFLEIHLFWAGKGTCCIPNQFYYGPAISALSATTPKKGSEIVLIVGIVVGATVLASVFAGLYVWWHKRKKSTIRAAKLHNIVGRPNVFNYSYCELRTAVENFSSCNLLGEGGYGTVYKGQFTDGSMVAVKQLSETSRQGKRQFIAEVETISQVQHRNLVKLYGCCLEGNKPLLVYQYMENGSLDKALFGSGRMTLDWSTRYKICLGIARGLAYLHQESSIRVVHRDIKASNVLLDTNLNPKISDFGLAKLYDDKKTHVSTKVAGTFGYLAPEYAMRGHMTEKVDVFAFGVVMLEIISGRPNHDDRLDEDMAYLLEWVWQHYEEDHPLDVVDARLAEFNSDEVLRAIRVGLLCIQSSPRQRPSMSRVVSMLTGDREVAEAVTKPSYITEWQMNARGQSSSGPGVETMSSVIHADEVVPELCHR